MGKTKAKGRALKPLLLFSLIAAFLAVLGIVLIAWGNQSPPSPTSLAVAAQTAAIEAHLGPFPLALSAEPPKLLPEVQQRLEIALSRTHLPGPVVPVDPSARVSNALPTLPETIALAPGVAASYYAPMAPGDFKFFRNADLGAGAPSGYTSVVNEPSVGVKGNVVFYSGNWYAARSTDGGQTFSFVNPLTTFPSVNGGFCCDQIVLYDPSRDVLFWLLQYIQDGNTGTQRIAVDKGMDGVFECYYDFTPQDVGFPNQRWFDFPNLTLSNNFLYHTSNVFTSDAIPQFAGAYIGRYPLDQFSTCANFSPVYYTSATYGSFRATDGATTAMYWAAHNSTSSIRIYKLPESSTTVSIYDRSITAWPLNLPYSCPGPDGKNWCARAGPRHLGAWVANGVIGFMWGVPQGSGGFGNFPYPYIQIARFSESDMSLLGEPYIWNSSFAWLYPSVGVNARGHLGGTLFWGGGSYYPNCAAWIADDLNGSILQPLESYRAVGSTNGPDANKWGDYLATRPHFSYSNTWVASCYSLQGGGANANARPQFVWFGRERDRPPGLPPQTAWVARYQGPGNNLDVAVAIALDGQGNSYVTGYSQGSGTSFDYATVKYDAQGNQLWVARYDNLVNSYDFAYAIALDGQGNVYVTGSSWGSGTGSDYATVKYDSQGNQLWAARYNGPSNGLDYATAIALDGQGNAYVTGVSYTNSLQSTSDYATVKYDGQGNQLWAARYNGPGNGDDAAHAIALDGQGNAYVTGSSAGSGTFSDYATVKYDAQGNQLWAARYNGPDGYYDYATAIALDSQGNAYVTGYSAGSGTGNDYATVKYDSQGNQLWAARYNGIGNGEDFAYAIAVDGQGNVYVTGTSWGGAKAYYATVKYDGQGNQLWVARYSGVGDGNAASAIALDGQGNVYVTGWSWGSGTDSDYATVKYYGAAVVPVVGPKISIAPASLEVTLRLNETVPYALVVNNLGLGPLAWSLTENPSVDWLSESLQSGSVAPGGKQQLDIVFNSTGLALGPYNAILKVASNDPDAPLTQVPVTIHVSNAQAAAVAASSTRIDADGAAGAGTVISKVYDSQTLGDLPQVHIGSYQATLQYNGTLLNVLEVRLKAPFATGTVTIDNPNGSTQLSASTSPAASWPIDPLAFVTMRLLGCVDQTITLTPTFGQILDGNGAPLAIDQPAAKTYRRGDAKADGTVNISDALFIAQYLAGIRGIGETTSLVSAVNTASVKQDGAFDKISSADVLLIAQYVVGLRNKCFLLVTGATPPER